jgi:uncharacterized protein (DUF1919 family)
MSKTKRLNKLYRKFLRRHINEQYQQKITNKNCSIISMNCVGGVVSHEFGLRFNSPTVNLWFKPKEFIKFLEQKDYYLYDCELQEDVRASKELGYPVGRLDDIGIYFTHYESFEEAKRKWNERLKRLDMNNIYIVMVQKDGCTEQDIRSFDRLKFKHKVVFTAKEYPQYRSAYYIPQSEENEENVKNLCDYQGIFTGKRWLDEFDWISFLNER